MSDIERLMAALRIRAQRPFLAWTEEEQKNFPYVIEKLISAGVMVILGEKRCFMCGQELGEVFKATRSSPIGVPMIVMNLCEKCSQQSDYVNEFRNN